MFKKRRSIKIGKGVRVNIGKKGVSSVSLGGKGVTLNTSKKGLKATASVRGTGISSSGYIVKSNSKSDGRSRNESGAGFIVWFLFIGLIIWLLLK